MCSFIIPKSHMLVPVWSVCLICLEILGYVRTGIIDENLSAVTTLIGSESLFADMRRLKAQGYDDKEEPHMRPFACRTILSSGFFVDECFLAEVPNEVKAAHVELLQKLNLSTQPYTYVPRDIAFRDKVVSEMAFSCFAWSNRSRSVIEYLISREYNWSWHWRTRVRAIALQSGHGRTASQGPADLIAMGENVAVVSFDFDELNRENEYDKEFEILEANWWEHDTPYRNPNDSAEIIEEQTTTTEKPFYRVDDGDEGKEMCDTTLEQRVRLCSQMMNAEVYRGKIVYSPYEEDRYTLKLPPACRRYELLFNHENKEIVVPKWEIGCHVTDVESGKLVTYGISIGVKSDHFLISHPAAGNRNVITAHSEHLWP